MSKLRIGITIGDINGIGPEILIKTLQDSRLRNLFVPVIYGSARVLNTYKKFFQQEKFHYVVVPNTAAAKPGTVNLIECLPEVDKVEMGLASEVAGRCALAAFQRAIDDALHQQIDAMVTLPLDKATVRLSQPDFTGHTEMLGQAFGAQENLMMMVAEDMRVALVTNHVALKDVHKNISTERIVAKARLLAKSLQEDFSIEKPVIAILGLNPHAGDDGAMGMEEKDIIIPAIQQLNKQGYIVQGPYSPDGFFGSLSFRKFDGVLAMYHDQGLIPFKLHAGTSGINFTAGVPFVRTSPDHGVAYNIVGKGTADENSFRNAIYAAIDIYERRSENQTLKAGALKIEKKQVSREEAEATSSFDL